MVAAVTNLLQQIGWKGRPQRHALETHELMNLWTGSLKGSSSLVELEFWEVGDGSCDFFGLWLW